MCTTYFRNENVHTKKIFLEKFQYTDEINFGKCLNNVLYLGFIHKHNIALKHAFLLKRKIFTGIYFEGYRFHSHKLATHPLVFCSDFLTTNQWLVAWETSGISVLKRTVYFNLMSSTGCAPWKSPYICV